MTNLETLKWDGKKAGKISIDLKVAKETSSPDLIHRAVLRQLANKRKRQKKYYYETFKIVNNN